MRNPGRLALEVRQENNLKRKIGERGGTNWVNRKEGQECNSKARKQRAQG